MFSEENVQRQKEALDAKYRQHGIKVVSDYVPETPDIPPCDYCGKNWSGNQSCGRCKMVFYCGRECQTCDWKHGHKEKCPKMNEISELAAKEVVSIMKDPDLAPWKRVSEEWRRLDVEGPYRIAVQKYDLNGVMYQLMRDDSREALNLNCQGCHVSFVRWIMTVIFRGERREGKGNDSGAFGHLDPSRCRSYLKSSDDAFEVWWKASLVTVTMFLDPRIARRDANRYAAMRMARDVASAWTMALTDPKISKAIFLKKTNNGERKKNIQRVEKMLTELGKTINIFWNAPNDLDTDHYVEAHMVQVGGMVHLRCQEYGIKLKSNTVELLGLNGRHQAMFLRVVVPFAKAKIVKGGILTNAENESMFKEVECDELRQTFFSDRGSNNSATRI